MNAGPRRYIVGLTGGIGSGKSEAARYLASLGAQVVDTDEISHRLTGPDGAAMPAIRARFGPDFVSADGRLDRARMRARVFTDADSKRALEAILHPMIREMSLRELTAGNAPYAVLVVPLLFETGQYRPLLMRTLVIDCDEAVQVQRVAARSGLTADEIRRIMSSQCSRQARLEQADDVVDNSGALSALHSQLDRLHCTYLALASQVCAVQPNSGTDAGA